MPLLNHLPDDIAQGVNRTFARLLILFGYVISLAMALDPAGWDDPVFDVVRKVPFTPYSWAAILGSATSLYALGELSPERTRGRGLLIVGGALSCAAWALGMALAMSRMVYMMPERITVLWPLVMLFVALLYSARAIVHANAFTAKRWSTNPYQLWATLGLMMASLAQIIIGVVPSSVFTEIERPVALQLALINFSGGAVVMFGLHVRNQDLGLNLELWGACSLVATVGWFCVQTSQQNILAGTTLGFALDEAFLFASLHRAIQIITLKYARLRGKPRLEDRLAQALHAERRVLVAVPDDDTEPTGRHGR